MLHILHNSNIFVVIMEAYMLPGSQFPPGFRFHPTDQELIVHYLQKKVASSLTPATSIIADIDLYKFNPWQLPGRAVFGEGEWFFFTPRDRKYPNGSRPNRAAGSGYWKATGTDKPIIAVGGSECLGVKKALVFYEGRPPKGVKTDWVMNEYRLLDDKSSPWTQKHKGSMRLDDWVLCRVRQKGSISTDIDEKQGTSNFANPSTSLNSEEHIEGERKYEIYEWSDNQLLAYLLGSQEGRESTLSEDSVSPKSFNNDNSNGYNIYYSTDLAQSPQPFSNAFESLKRKLSFGAMDELMLQQPPSKRSQYSTTSCEHRLPSPTSSFSVDQASTEFII